MHYILNLTKSDGSKSKTIVIETVAGPVDIVKACKKAAEDYVKTDEWFQYIDNYPQGLPWTDLFFYVPSNLFLKYGLCVHEDAEEITVCEDDVLAEDPAFILDNIKWRTAGEQVSELPNKETIPYKELLSGSESLRNLTLEELKDRVPGYLCEKYSYPLEQYCFV